MLLRIGTRKSKLALIQTNLVIGELKKHYPLIDYKIVPITTTGDKIVNKDLYDIGGKALFLKELEEALLYEKIDLAVHSLKDIPGNLSSYFEIAAVLKRNAPNEVLISKTYNSIDSLPFKAIVGSSSVRRRAFLLNKRPDLHMVTFRGNVDSRVNKVLNNEVDATLLAATGLYRLNLFDKNYCHSLELTDLIPAPCQGIIAIEILKNNNSLKEICQKINHLPTFNLVKVERGYVDYLNASCTTPVAAFAEYLTSDTIVANFMLATDYHSPMKFHTMYGNVKEANTLGVEAAKILLEKISSKNKKHKF